MALSSENDSSPYVQLTLLDKKNRHTAKSIPTNLIPIAELQSLEEGQKLNTRFCELLAHDVVKKFQHKKLNLYVAKESEAYPFPGLHQDRHIIFPLHAITLLNEQECKVILAHEIAHHLLRDAHHAAAHKNAKNNMFEKQQEALAYACAAIMAPHPESIVSANKKLYNFDLERRHKNAASIKNEHPEYIQEIDERLAFLEAEYQSRLTFLSQFADALNEALLKEDTRTNFFQEVHHTLTTRKQTTVATRS